MKIDMDQGPVCLYAAAKVNLFLEVLKKRSDGYHDIRSVVVPVSLCDKVTLKRTAGDISTEVTDTDLIIPGDNLVTKAAMLLREATKCEYGARITLEKNIPVGGGLGGGSADAAIVLKGLNSLWGTGLSLQRLCDLGAELGCDLPALLHNSAVLVEGVGERITNLDQFRDADADIPGTENQGWWLVIANPGFEVSTADIYSRCKRALTSGTNTYKDMVSALLEKDLESASCALFNGLQETVFCKYPLIRILAESLDKAGAVGSLVSGSGGSVFGLARNQDHAKKIRDSVCRILGESVWITVARTLPDGVMAAHGPLTALV